MTCLSTDWVNFFVRICHPPWLHAWLSHTNEWFTCWSVTNTFFDCIILFFFFCVSRGLNFTLHILCIVPANWAKLTKIDCIIMTQYLKLGVPVKKCIKSLVNYWTIKFNINKMETKSHIKRGTSHGFPSLKKEVMVFLLILLAWIQFWSFFAQN